jgi:epoxyqueuosine reductase
VCQEVCPWNSRSPVTDEAAFAPRAVSNPVDLIELFALDDEAFRARFRHTPLWRAKRRGILRNAAIALGNRPTPQAVPALTRGLHDAEPLVRGACAWALGHYPQGVARQALERRRVAESDHAVRSEIDRAVAEASRSEAGEILAGT